MLLSYAPIFSSRTERRGDRIQHRPVVQDRPDSVRDDAPRQLKAVANALLSSWIGVRCADPSGDLSKETQERGGEDVGRGRVRLPLEVHGLRVRQRPGE